MFSTLTSSFSSVLSKLSKGGVLSEADFDKAIREIRIALLEADVALPVIKEFIAQVKDKVIGQKALKGIEPINMIIKIINDQLVNVLGDDGTTSSSLGAGVCMLVGLQGAGKTTTTAKLALLLKKQEKRKILMASLDVYRPAAQLQLESLGKQIGIDTLPIVEGETVLQITKRALEEKKHYDVLLLDTAGRLHIDDKLMSELREIASIVSPNEILMVADSMMGQDSVNVAREFSKNLDLTGIVLTRVDGDARGGVALSMKIISGVPIKFMGMGEKLNELQIFHPERIASRILGKGDIVSLVEKAQEVIGQEEVEKLAGKFEKGSFDMNDLLKQLKQIKKIGSISSLLSMLPGVGGLKLDSSMIDEGLIKRYEAIMNSMTSVERKDPTILDSSRKKRIQKGSGTSVQEINRLFKQYMNMKNMMKKFGKMDHKNMSQIAKIFK